MKDQILNLRKEGKTYREIEKVLGCSRSLISYYVNPATKKQSLQRQNRNRFSRRTKYKMLLGGKCSTCDYNRCLDALHFHHKDPTTKLFSISDAIWQGKFTEKQIVDEVQKCTLLCANCHAEVHSENDFQRE